MRSRYPRLSPIDLMMLRTETAAAPQHIGGLCLVDAGPLCDPKGALDIARIKERVGVQVAALPELRRVARYAPLLCGRPVWVDDPDFSIDRHVRVSPVHAADEKGLLDAAEVLLRPPLVRSHPLWELWILTGMSDHRIGLLFKVHHALADGLAAVRLIASLLAETAEPAASTDASRSAMPPAGALFLDNIRCRTASVVMPFRHPVRNLRSLALTLAYASKEMAEFNAAPSSSLNRPARPARILQVLHLDLETALAISHRHGAKVNDLILAVVAGGVAELLRRRGETIVGGEVITAIGVNLRDTRTSGAAGNAVGALRVRLPLGHADPNECLEAIAARTRAAKATQHISLDSSNFVLGLVGWLATIGVSFAERQRMINFFVSNVRGPAIPLLAFGARVDDVFPIVGLFGNETVSFVAFSYCGRLNLVAIADRESCPDAQALLLGMQSAWRRLAPSDAAARREEPVGVAPGVN